MKAALAQFIFESNTFTPGLAEIDLFRKGGVFLEDEARVRAWAAGPTRRCTAAWRCWPQPAGKPPPVSPPSAALPPDA